jgi:TPR repeat protein
MTVSPAEFLAKGPDQPLKHRVAHEQRSIMSAKRYLIQRIGIVPFFALLIFAATPPAGAVVATTGEGERLALIVGNSHYRAVPELKNAINDAKLISQTLASVGFTVTAVQDTTKADFEKSVLEFKKTITPNSIVVVYYAGHGVQIGDENYLLPVDAEVSDAAGLSFSAVSATSILGQLQASGSKAVVFILDACRDNPFVEKLATTRSVGQPAASRGLAIIRSNNIGSLIAFATAPGKTAVDGEGDNGPYSVALAENLKQPGLLIEEVFKRTRAAVLRATDGVQVPWENSSLVSSVVLVPDADRNAAAPVVTACDLLAGHPSDPERVGPGVLYENLDPQTAIPSCQQAIAEHPDQPRYKSLAARALEKAGRYDEAIALNQEAMQSGYLGAYHNLGNHYKKGAGVPQDLKKALELFEYAGERGEPEDQYNVGVLYIDGKGGIPVDYARAEEWLTKATEQNWAAAYDKLGILNLQGLGRPKDEAKANEYFRQGAALGDSSAMVNLADSYRQGRGLAKDLATAKDYYLRAANLGRVSAFVNLGNLYLKGQGTKADPVEALFWFRLAARSGQEYATGKVGELSKQLDEAAKEQVEEKLRVWDTKRFG